MKQPFTVSALFAVLLTALTPAPSSGQKLPPSTIEVTGPTVIAFFMAGRSVELTEAARADFDQYAAAAAPKLKESNVAFHQIYPEKPFAVRMAKETVTLSPKFGVGYYFLTPGAKPKVEYGIKTDIHLLQHTREHLPAAARRPRQ